MLRSAVSNREYRSSSVGSDQLRTATAMRILVTGSAGHLGEALMRVLQHSNHEAMGLDIKPSPFTQRVGSVTQRSFVKQCMQGVDVVLHTATLHKPHIATHTRQEFVDTNITCTVTQLGETVLVGAKSFVCANNTTAFRRSLLTHTG